MPKMNIASQQKRRSVPSSTPAGSVKLKNPPQQTVPEKDGLPVQAFAIAPEPLQPAGWLLPHHTRQVLKAVEGSVDWQLLEKATLLLSIQGDEGRRVAANPAQIIDASRHVAWHYLNAGKSIPTTLCALI